MFRYNLVASIAVTFVIAHGLIFDSLAANTRPRIPAAGKTPESFAPTGWTILKEAQGDLNGDDKADTAPARGGSASG
jgi:hypothetical protein